VGFKRFLAYSASAGSGKTYALSIRYIALLFLEQNPSSILAATFTKKAANEMSQRVIKFLEELSSNKELLANLAIASGLSEQEILKKQPAILAKFIKSQSFIVTLDSFFNSILRATSLQIGLDSSFGIKEGIKEELEEEFIKELKFNNKIDALVKLSVNLHKRKAQDVLELLDYLYTIDAILPKTSYFLQNLQSIQDEICNLREELLKETIASGASKSAVKIFTKSSFKELLKKGVFEKSSLSEHKFFKKYITASSQLEELFLKLKEKIAAYHLALEQSVMYYLFELFNSYKNAKLSIVKSKNELDFNDILYYTYKLVSNEVTKDFIYFKLDSKFKHILLDEFQDTSSLQYLILEPLIDEIFSGVGSSEFKSFFYVGDTKQSLYRFRGGVEELFEYVAKKYNIEIANLDTNYRSAKKIVNFTNKTFEDKIFGYVPQKPFSKKSGYVEIIKTSLLLEKAMQRVEFYINSGVKVEDIAILVFANKDGVVLQEYLSSFNIASTLKTSSSLKFNPKIAALVGVLEYIVTNEQLFLEPFLVHIGKSTIDLSAIDKTMMPFDILHILIKQHNYFCNDLNILKLLDFARAYVTVEEFLYEFKRSNITLGNSEQNGLQIMTIHGSKGLEFKHVIILDRLGGKMPNRDLLLFKNKDAITIDNIYYKYSKKENFLSDYAAVLNEQKNLTLKDRLNLLYVAITRAELSLSILLKDKNSEFDILNLEEKAFGDVESSGIEPTKELEQLSAHISKYARQKIQDSEQEEDIDKNYANIYFGEALHYVLELVNLQNGKFDMAIEALNNKYGYILDKEAINSIAQRVKNLLQNEQFQELIGNGKICKEQPFVYQESMFQIDLLIKKESCNIVIDYKSSKNYMQKHTKQVQNYTQAVAKITNKPTKGYIAYLLTDKIEINEVK